MKNLLTLFLSLILGYTLYAQAPQRFNYQGVARTGSGTALSNQALGLRISILSGGANGTVVFSETHSVTSNANGIFNIQIGGGTLVSGNFSAITWGSNVHFIRVEMDAAGGTSYNLLGTSQLLSVPYALNAASVSNVDWSSISNIPPGIADGDSDILASLSCGPNQVAVFNGSTWVCGNMSAGGNPDWNNINNIPSYLLDGDDDVLGSLSCGANQIPVFNGSSWVCSSIPSSTSGQNISDSYGTGQITLTAASTSYTVVPGLSQTITVPANAKVYVHTNGGIQTVGTGTTYGVADFAIHVDGAVSGPAGSQIVVSANTSGLGNMLDNWSFGKSYTLTPGTHTIDVRVRDGSGSADVNVSGTNPLIQGVMTIIIIKQ